jgi:hypothetical protein
MRNEGGNWFKVGVKVNLEREGRVGEKEWKKWKI